MLAIDRGTYWQIAYVIRKGGYDEVVANGLPALRESVAALVPELTDRVGEVRSWDDVRVLTVQVDRLARWHAPGVLLIGDAAHAMSPIGGVGINLAIQDAVATARMLGDRLKTGNVATGDLARIRRRRLWPTVGTQAVQRLMQHAILTPVLSGRPVHPPRALGLLRRFPRLQALPARVIGIGLRPEAAA
jgi:2-polyprenyl-6-methoxyphenol hydroxylase-like FAD-dependent oxidoreductase